jgi:hypothetical protein
MRIGPEHFLRDQDEVEALAVAGACRAGTLAEAVTFPVVATVAQVVGVQEASRGLGNRVRPPSAEKAMVKSDSCWKFERGTRPLTLFS